MTGVDAVLLGDGELYDIIVDVVGDETSLEFCTLSSYYIDGNDLDTAMMAHGTNWSDIEPLIDEVEERSKERRSKKQEENDVQ